MGRPAGPLLRHGRDRLEPCRNDAGLHLQAAHGYGLCRIDRLGHLRLRRGFGTDAEHLQADELQHGREDRAAARQPPGLRQVSRLVARRPEDRLPLAAPRGQRVGQGPLVPLRLRHDRDVRPDRRFRLQRHECRLGGQRPPVVRRADRGHAPDLPYRPGRG